MKPVKHKEHKTFPFTQTYTVNTNSVGLLEKGIIQLRQTQSHTPFVIHPKKKKRKIMNQSVRKILHSQKTKTVPALVLM